MSKAQLQAQQNVGGGPAPHRGYQMSGSGDGSPSDIGEDGDDEQDDLGESNDVDDHDDDHEDGQDDDEDHDHPDLGESGGVSVPALHPDQADAAGDEDAA